jgi:hypothetical protein
MARRNRKLILDIISILYEGVTYIYRIICEVIRKLTVLIMTRPIKLTL